MLDIHWIREHPELVQQAAEQKGLGFSVEELLVWDNKRRKLLAKRAAQLAQKNAKNSSKKPLPFVLSDDWKRPSTFDIITL